MYIIVAKCADGRILYFGTFTTKGRAESYALSFPMQWITSWEVKECIQPYINDRKAARVEATYENVIRFKPNSPK